MAHAEAFSVERTLCKTQRRECALCSANRRHARLSSLGRAEPQRALVRVQQSSLRCARAELLHLRPLISYATTCHRHCGTRLQVLVCLEQRAISARIIARRALEQLAIHVRAPLFAYPQRIPAQICRDKREFTVLQRCCATSTDPRDCNDDKAAECDL